MGRQTGRIGGSPVAVATAAVTLLGLTVAGAAPGIVGATGAHGGEAPTVERVSPDGEVTVQAGTTVMFEVAVEAAGPTTTDWHVDGEWAGDSLGPWHAAYTAQQGVEYFQHTFEENGTHEVTATVTANDSETRRTNWTVHVEANGSAAPAVDAVSPDREAIAPGQTDETDLELEVSDPDGDLDRVVWWLGMDDAVLGVSDVAGASDTATLSPDGELDCHGCPIIAWVIDDDGAVTERLAWTIDPQADRSDDLDREIVVESTGDDRASYEFTVTGDVAFGERANPADGPSDPSHPEAIDGSTATGSVLGGVDDFRFSGEVTDLEVDGPAVVYVDGERVDPATVGSPGSTMVPAFSPD